MLRDGVADRGFRVKGQGLRVQGSGFKDLGLGPNFMVEG